MTYRDEMIKAMHLLGGHPSTVFIGQSIRYPGNVMFATLKDVPIEKRIELPVFEDSQMGMSIGLSLAGYIPVSIFPRMDFLICAINQLVNHLDKMEAMSHGRVIPKVIIRSLVGTKIPLDSGPQHTGNYIEAIRKLVTNIDIYALNHTEGIYPSYESALNSKRSSILIEFGDAYEVKKEFKT